MPCVTVEEILYIKDIPVELLDEAVEAGELREGKIVGLKVKACGRDESLTVELKLRERGQERLLNPGQRIPVEQAGEVLVPRQDWRECLEPAEARSACDSPCRPRPSASCR